MSAAIDTPYMAESAARKPLTEAARRLQHELLDQVSRTFALTIPCLPADLADVVGNAYLLCRIVDTIEDELDTDNAARDLLYARFRQCLSIESLDDDQSAADFARSLAALLPQSAPAGEQFLVERVPDVLDITASFTQQEQAILRRCVAVMTQGMREFQVLGSNGQGLESFATLDRYCYHVAGCVGELLTELFCLHDPGIASRRDQLMPLSRAFGSGLQVTNILKDMWVDHERGVCWLPLEAFTAATATASARTDLSNTPASLPELMQRAIDGDPEAVHLIDQGTGRLVARCRADLDQAMRYVRTIPRTHRGLRVFCLWSIGLSVLTLRKIRRLSVSQRLGGTKVSRNSVRLTLLFSGASAGLAPVMQAFYSIACFGLPRR